MTRLFFLSPATPVANDKSSIITTVCNIQTRDLSSNEENYISDCMFNSLPSTLIQCSVLQTQTANEEQKHTSALSESINRYGFKIKYIRSIPRASVRLPVSDANVHVCVCVFMLACIQSSFSYPSSCGAWQKSVLFFCWCVTQRAFLPDWPGIPSLVYPYQPNCHSCVWVKKPSPSSGVYRIPLPP